MSCYDLIHIQKNMIQPFYIVLEDDKQMEIRSRRSYNNPVSNFIIDILKLYKPHDKLFILDYNTENCFYSLLCKKAGYNTIYINPNKSYNKIIKKCCIVNDINLFILNIPRNINTLLKKKYVLLKIVNDSDEALVSKRLINNQKLPHIIILRKSKDIPMNYRKLMNKGYVFYKLSAKSPLKISNIKTFIIKDLYSPIVAVHRNSKYRDSLTVYFD